MRKTAVSHLVATTQAALRDLAASGESSEAKEERARQIMARLARYQTPRNARDIVAAYWQGLTSQ